LLEEKIGAPAVILGHSLGTILALKILEARPKLIRGLIFAGGLPRARPEIRERLAPRAEAIARNGIAGWGKKVSPGIFSPAAMRKLPETVQDFENRFEAQDAGAYARSIRILLAADASASVATAHVPCLAVTGALDSYAPPGAVQEFAGKIPGGCRVEILPGCGHMPFFEAPDKFAEVIGNFLDGMPKAR
jgi:3-oxoadipate enol-lactonase